ncbi:hypothetical protein [Nocardia pseudovaccinii]|uniref:hypothetical protein n=1 Tax=Nocardia pseudovaccinii TaxID=189540 RepID=UPI0007A52FB3|nr:hypothetical protein [Nocardia pseudovaccinii]
MTYTTTSTGRAEDLCRQYRRENEFDAEVNADERIVVRVDELAAIRIWDEALVERVRQELERRNLTVPTIVITRPVKLWTFLTARVLPEDRLTSPFDPLYRHPAARAIPGSLITLPGPDDPVRSWLVRPAGAQRPEFATLLAITLDAARSLPHRR